MKYRIVFLLIMFISSSALSQRLLKISVSNGANKTVLPYIVNNGITYVSTKELSKILSGNFYYNPTAQKVEMKFKNYNLKVTAKNQFFVITSKYNFEKDVTLMTSGFTSLTLFLAISIQCPIIPDSNLSELVKANLNRLITNVVMKLMVVLITSSFFFFFSVLSSFGVY